MRMDWGWQFIGLAATLLVGGGLWWAYRWARNRAEAAVFGLLLILIVAVVFARYLPDTARQGLA
ncbi:MAG: hypothetical protein HY320_07450, partial [Armatimonadetes bacterium]|nr:hypothetical protein [Armatimonadota bacterium]